MQRRGPEIDEVHGQRGLRLERLQWVGHVVLAELPDRSDHFAALVGALHLDLARLARPQICGQHLAALLYGLTNVAGERFRVGNWKLGSETVSLPCVGGGGGRAASAPRLVGRVWKRSRKAALPSVWWQPPASEWLAARLFFARWAPHLRRSAQRLGSLGRRAWLLARASCDPW